MGGSRTSRGSCSSWSESSVQISCQICDDALHTAIDCPFLYSACPECGSIRRLWKSRVSTSKDKLFLRCTMQPNCTHFEWLDDAIRVYLSSGKPTQYNSGVCFHCGAGDHIKKKCPNSPSPRKAVAPPKVETPQVEDKASNMSPSTPAKLIINTTLGELYEKFSSGCKPE